MKKITMTLGFVLAVLIINAQTEISINDYIRLPKDSIESHTLLANLHSFIQLAQAENKDNTFVLPSQQTETYILLDEFKGIEAIKGNKHFFKPYLSNVIKRDDGNYFLQISYIGVADSLPNLRAMFTLIAHKTDEFFLFSSPLIENTKEWKSKTIEKFTFFYETDLNETNAAKHVEKAKLFDEKLKVENKSTKFYCTNSRPELLQLIGVNYKLDYNGRNNGVYNAANENEQLIVLGNNNARFDNFDPHDLWHDRLSLVVSRREVNKPVDEACAYLYGGSWGMSWEDIFNLFIQKVATNKEANWKDYKENPFNFGESKAEHLMVDYVINALLVKKIEQEKGFSGVWELLNCGKYEKGNERYYEVLNKITGITKDGYNAVVWKLIKDETSVREILNLK